jgi:hypothetical protein
VGVALPLMRPSLQRWVPENSAWIRRARMAQIRRGQASEVVSIARAEIFALPSGDCSHRFVNFCPTLANPLEPLLTPIESCRVDLQNLGGLVNGS